MGKKKKNKGSGRSFVDFDQEAGKVVGEGLSPTDIQARQKVVSRLAKAMKHMSEPPEPLLSLFERLEIPWEKVQNVPGDPSHDTLVIRWTDILAGEQRNQTQGSILQRLYGTEGLKDLAMNVNAVAESTRAQSGYVPQESPANEPAKASVPEGFSVPFAPYTDSNGEPIIEDADTDAEDWARGVQG